MATMRKPNMRGGMVDLGMALVALLAGLAGAPYWAAALVFALAVGVWWWTRRNALARLELRARLTQSAAALAVLAIVLGLFYWLGLQFGGHT
jgi:hypothetical protein